MEKLTCSGKEHNCGFNTIDNSDKVELINGVLHCHECDLDTSIKEARENTKLFSKCFDERTHYFTY